MDLSKFSRDDLIMGGLALLLAIDLLFLPWFSGGGGTLSTPVGNLTIGSVSLTATETPDGWLGILAVLAALALLADLALDRLGAAELPSISGSRTTTRLVLASAAAVFMALKFLFHIHFSIFGFGFWVGVVIAGGLVFFARQAHIVGPAAAAPRRRPPSSGVPPRV